MSFIKWFNRNCKPYWLAAGYMHRTFIIPRNPWFNIYFHKFVGSDGPVMHDHPWSSISIMLWGSYKEFHPKVHPDGWDVRRAGDITFRFATDRHRIELISSEPVYTLFITGVKWREWGYWCKSGWVHFEEYHKRTNGIRLANGCGEE